ncbi:MAG: hypothetical protein KQH63_03630 [Desulfobulbaceae bacterium]|nr:hypothetical protein [Desulfobulbaceae bacterium]
MKSIDHKIEILRDTEARLTDELQAVREQISVLERKRARQLWNVKPGSTVESASRKYEVAEVNMDGDSKPWLKARLIHPDGTIRTQVKNLYWDWELIKT